MPVAMTFNSLQTDLQNWLQRQDTLVLSQIPNFINLAQYNIVNGMKILGFRTEVTGDFPGTTQQSGLMQKPSDWRKTIGFWCGTGTGNNVHQPVYERTYEYLREVYPDPTYQGSTPQYPRFYADADYNHWLVLPAPSSASPFKIAYYGTLVFLDNNNQTNWLTINAPNMLLYASLMEAIPFVKADERIPVWQSMYQQQKLAFQQMELEGLYDTQEVTGEPQPSFANPPLQPTAQLPPPR